MAQVTLVCTVHEDQGRANASELHAILEHIRPEVIFLELPRTALADYYETCVRDNLESRAVRRYRENNQVELVSVDVPTPEPEFFTNFQNLCQVVSKSSTEYHRLLDRNNVRTRLHGFAHLNSQACSDFWFEFYEEISRTIARIGDPRLLEIYECWNAVMDRRDIGMIENVNRFCTTASCSRSALLVGAAHRRGIIARIQGQSHAGPMSIEWDHLGSCSDA